MMIYKTLVALCLVLFSLQGDSMSNKTELEAFKVAIYNTILYYIKAGINSERCTMRNLLEQQGHKDLAKILTELK